MLGQIDTSLFFVFNHFLQEQLPSSAVVFFTRHSEYLFMVLAIILFRTRQWAATARLLALMLVAVAVSDALGFVLKDLIGRERPCHALEGARVLVYCGKSFAMPSNHALNTFTLAGVALFMSKDRLRYAFCVLAALVALTRPIVGVHYLSDIIAGAALGLALAWGMVRLHDWVGSLSEERRLTTVLWLILGGMAAFRAYYIIYGPLDLSPDEAHYWEWTRHPALSYYSKGPMVAWLITIGTAIFGNTEFGVRVPAVLLSVLSSVLLYMLGRDMYDRQTGFFAAVLYQIIPLFSAYGIVMTIDPPFMFFWLLALYQMRRLLRNDTLMNWALLGMIVGTGMLAKYTMAFFIICSLCWFVFDRQKRGHFFKPGPYVGVAFTFVFFSPVLLWNAMNDWVTFRHTSGHVNVAGGLSFTPDRFVEFVGSQFGVFTPVLFVLMVISVLRSRDDERGKFLFWYSAPVFVFFVLKSLQGKVEANWSMMAYLTGLLALSRDWFAGFGGLVRWKRALVAAGFCLAFAMSVVALYASDLGIPPRLDPSARSKGWEGVALEADRAIQEMEGPVFIFSNSYQVVSELAFYMEGNPVTYNINIGRRMTQYDLWPGIEGREGQSGLFVTMSDRKFSMKVREAFDNCRVRKFKARDDEGNHLRVHVLALCEGFKGRINEREINEY